MFAKQLCRGFTIKHVANGKLLEMLIVAMPNGDVFACAVQPVSSSFKPAAGDSWFKLQNVTIAMLEASARDKLEFCGNYPIDSAHGF